jgi:hypothetical protein
MKFKLHVFILLTFLSSMPCSGQSYREQQFLSVLETVVSALAHRDSTTLSKYIDSETGVYILNRIGLTDTYMHFPAMGFSDTTYPNVPFYDEVKLSPIAYSKLPTYDCDKWTQTGTFVDTTKVDHLLSEIANGLNKVKKNSVPSEKIRMIYNLEKRSRRIVIADNGGDELIIYLSFIKNRWVLTIIDKVTADSSV